jgi:hypothetical protein
VDLQSVPPLPVRVWDQPPAPAARLGVTDGVTWSGVILSFFTLFHSLLHGRCKQNSRLGHKTKGKLESRPNNQNGEKEGQGNKSKF